jgi:cytoskeletal protein RodZ
MMAREASASVSDDDARAGRRANASTSSESESESETSPRARAVVDDGCLDSDDFETSLKALEPRRRNIDATIRAQERACVDITLAVDAMRAFLTNARDDEESSEGAEERRDALEAAALTKRIVAIVMETRAIVNRVRQKLIEAGFVDVEALTPYDPEA